MVLAKSCAIRFFVSDLGVLTPPVSPLAEIGIISDMFRPFSIELTHSGVPIAVMGHDGRPHVGLSTLICAIAKAYDSGSKVF